MLTVSWWRLYLLSVSCQHATNKRSYRWCTPRGQALASRCC